MTGKSASIASRSGHHDALFDTTASCFASGTGRFGSSAATPACDDAQSLDETVRRLSRQRRRLILSRRSRAVPARRVGVTVVPIELPVLSWIAPHHLVAIDDGIAPGWRRFTAVSIASGAAPRCQSGVPACLLIRSLVPGIAKLRRLAVQHRSTALPASRLTMLSCP